MIKKITKTVEVELCDNCESELNLFKCDICGGMYCELCFVDDDVEFEFNTELNAISDYCVKCRDKYFEGFIAIGYEIEDKIKKLDEDFIDKTKGLMGAK